MDIIGFSVYRGRNIYSHRPVVKMIVDIGEYNDTPTKDIEGFNEKLLRYFPNLKTNTCGLGYEGGFLERLREGTYLGHVLEHVILDMENTLGFDVKYGKTRLYQEPSTYYLIYEYMNEDCAVECGKEAAAILNRFIRGEEAELGQALERLDKIILKTELGPSTSAIVAEAKKRGIPVTRIGSDSLVRLGYGKHSRLIESTLTDATSCISADIASDKQLTRELLADLAIPVPHGRIAHTEISAVAAAKELGFPVAVKPLDSNQGKGVQLNLTSEREVKAAFREAAEYSRSVIVERYIPGGDYRVLVVGGKVRAVSHRMPPVITGDGVHTIKELVDIANLDPMRGESHEKPLTRIRLDNHSLNLLRRNGMTLEDIPKRGRKVALRSNGNLSTGGTATDRTGCLHPDNAEIAVRAAEAVGLDVAGVDIVAEDISESISEGGGAVIEVNAAPGIRMHLYPSKGRARNVAKDILDTLCPDGCAARFPIVSVTGTNGKTTTVRIIHHVLSGVGLTVGMTSTNGTWAGDKLICKGDNSGPRSARALLADRSIEAAVLETARGGIIREGLGYDLADVGIVTNISEDHLGLDGVDTLEDLALVKSLVAEAVKPDGVAVLNGGDRMTPMILKRLKSQAMLFYPEKPPEDKVSEGVSVYVEDGMIILLDSGRRIKIVNVGDIPITCGGLLDCNIENCLAAVCALYALKVPTRSIAAGLKSFNVNTGRFQIFDMNEYKIMLDYAHNPAGYKAVSKLCERYGHNRLVGVIGMPGDRPDDAITAVGGIAARTFDRIYIKEDSDLRGRKKHEVAELLYRSMPPESKEIFVVDDEVSALRQAMDQSRKGDLIVVLYEKIEPLVELLRREGGM